MNYGQYRASCGRVRVDSVDGSALVRADRCERSDVHQGRRADLPGEVRVVPPARFDRADVARDLRAERVRGPGRFATACRRGRCRPGTSTRALGIQHFENDRSLSDAEIDTIVKWVAAGAPKGDMKDMPKPVEWPSDDVWNFAKLYGKPDLVLKSPPTPRRATRWTRGTSRCRPPASPKTAGCAPSRCAPARSRAARSPTTRWPACSRTTATTGSSIAPGADEPGPRPLHGMGRRQAGRDHARELRQADEARLEDRVGHPLPRGRRGHHRLGRTRHLLLPEGPGAEVPPDAGALQRHHRRQPRPRHRAQLAQRDAELPRDEEGRPRRELPAAHAPARQGDVDGSDPADRRRCRCSAR